MLREAYTPVSPEAGRFLYALVRSVQPGTVVEFGTSFGISTIVKVPIGDAMELSTKA